jgi:hypothetical protein
MPALVYRITEVLSALVQGLPIGTNLGLFHILWALLSGRLLPSRGALIPALAATGLEPAAVRRAWAAFARGAWDIAQLLAGLQTLVQTEARWQARRHGGYRVLAVDTLGFFRPRLKGCFTKHFLSAADRSLPAIPFGLMASVGAVGDQTVPILRRIVRAPSPSASPTALMQAVLKQVALELAPDEAAVLDGGFTPRLLQAAQVPRWVSRVPRNFTARRSALPAYRGRGRRPSRGVLVRPLARTRQGRQLDATPPDRTETATFADRSITADIWSELCLAKGGQTTATFQCVVIRDPAYSEAWVLLTNLTLPVAELLAFYHDRWPIEQVPLTAKQLLGAERQFVFADAPRQRLPELALFASSLLMYLAATHPVQPTGFWDRAAQPTSGRLRRVLAQLDISKTPPLPSQLRKKESVTTHLPKGVLGHRRSASPSAPPT